MNICLSAITDNLLHIRAAFHNKVRIGVRGPKKKTIAHGILYICKGYLY